MEAYYLPEGCPIYADTYTLWLLDTNSHSCSMMDYARVLGYCVYCAVRYVMTHMSAVTYKYTRMAV